MSESFKVVSVLREGESVGVQVCIQVTVEVNGGVKKRVIVQVEIDRLVK